EHHNAQLSGHAIKRELAVAQAVRVGPKIDTHEARLAVGRVLMPDQRGGCELLDVARVFPHFEVELHAVVGNEAGEQLEPDSRDDKSEERRVGKECRYRWSTYT